MEVNEILEKISPEVKEFYEIYSSENTNKIITIRVKSNYEIFFNFYYYDFESYETTERYDVIHIKDNLKVTLYKKHAFIHIIKL